MYDSADDLQSAGSQPRSPTHESVSEFGDLTLGATSSADTALMQDRDSAMGDTAVRTCQPVIYSDSCIHAARAFMWPCMFVRCRACLAACLGSCMTLT